MAAKITTPPCAEDYITLPVTEEPDHPSLQVDHPRDKAGPGPDATILTAGTDPAAQLAGPSSRSLRRNIRSTPRGSTRTVLSWSLQLHLTDSIETSQHAPRRLLTHRTCIRWPSCLPHYATTGYEEWHQTYNSEV